MPSYKQWLVWSTLGLVGCQEVRTEDKPSFPAVELATRFDPAATGTLRGRVVWQGAIPEVKPFEVYASRDSQPDMPPRGPRPNPNAPRIALDNRGIQYAVIYLREVEPSKSRPWDHAPVRIEQVDWDLQVRQGTEATRIGFVRRGQEFVAASTQKALHIL